MTIATRLASELSVAPKQVQAAIRLLDEGATVPFIARYRKEATNGLDDTQLRNLEARLRYLREMDETRGKIIEAIEAQGKLTDHLREQLETAETKARLEDLYLPYKKKRRTRAQIAREAGLEPLTDLLLTNRSTVPEEAAEGFLNPEHKILTAKDALAGARQILIERLSEDADLVAALRSYMEEKGVVSARVIEGKEASGARFRDWFNYDEALGTVPSHRALALFRGRKEEVLTVGLVDPNAPETGPGQPEQLIARSIDFRDEGRAADRWISTAIRLAWRGRLSVRIEINLLGGLRERAEEVAIQVFATNLSDLLLAAPAGQRTTLGLDPGLRTGVKVVVVDPTGKVLATDTIYPHVPKKDWEGSLHTLTKLVKAHNVGLIAIGNGTASRETDRLGTELMSRLSDSKLTKVIVSEAGASVYSASELASKELPGMDVSLRGAVSIARRLQDPLAELVKIDPKSIGVGQYQHDVDQSALARSLDAVVEDCVNAVGVDLNTASPALLRRVAGLTRTLAGNIVAWRDENGAFANRKQLLKVGRLGPKTYEQCAGFLRIRNGDNPLDGSAVHPEAYPVVERIAQQLGRSIPELLGDPSRLSSLRPEQFVDDTFGLPTIKDILSELEKPGRDPRPEFRTAKLTEGVETLADLQPGMKLEGTVTNVTAFGAFVDLGVHQDGLVHISQLADRFVKDPSEVVRTGQVVSVKVLEVDHARKRISLTMRSDNAPAPRNSRGEGGRGRPRQDRSSGRQRRGRRDSSRPPRGNDQRTRTPKTEEKSTLGDLFGDLRRRR